MTRVAQPGFTLIELMIAVAIVALLTAIGVPAYTQYLVQSRRADGRELLERASADEQRFFTLYSTYTQTVSAPRGCSGQSCGLGYPGYASTEGYYLLSVAPGASGMGASFVLTATPTQKGGQSGDRVCKALTLSSTGARGFTGRGPARECWP